MLIKLSNLFNQYYGVISSMIFVSYINIKFHIDCKLILQIEWMKHCHVVRTF